MTAALLTAVSSSQAQSMQFGGLVLNQDILSPADMAGLSRTHAFGTARAMGMGGAFVSLGADMTSLTLNPAGLGMYRRNEISLTPLVPLAHTETAGVAPWTKNNKAQFAFANIGAALSLFESSSSALTSLTLGFGMNRVADFNTRYSFSSESRYDPVAGNLMPTIADVFGQQLGYGNGGASIFPSPGTGGDPNGSLGYDYDPGFWPAILGYNGYMINVEGSGADRAWVPSFIGSNASVIHSLDVESSGSINEFSLSLGGNINNVVYFGASLGIQSIHRKVGTTYQETYNYYDTNGQAYNSTGDFLDSQLDYASLYQKTVIDGSGVNFKVGVTVRPLDGLRLGVAFHTPTYYSLDYTYAADIETLGHNNQTQESLQAYDRTPEQRDEGSNNWSFTSPARLLLGASYTFGNFAILSVDYERDWYNGIRAKNLPDIGIPTEAYKQNFKQNFRATNTVRAGIELKPLPMLALRVGGGYSDSMLRDGSQYVNRPVAGESYYCTAGLGFNLSRSTVLDLAYQYVSQKQSSYQLFFSADTSGGGTELLTYSGLYNTELTRHYIALTLGFRF